MSAERFELGDIVRRADGDEQEIIDIDHDFGVLTVRCIKAPDTNWCEVGEVEGNLIRRYHFVRSGVTQ